VDPKIKQAAAAELSDPQASARIRADLSAEEQAALDAAKGAIQVSLDHWRGAVARKLSRTERAALIRDLFDRGNRLAEALDDSERVEFINHLLHRGVLASMTMEAGVSEFDSVGFWGDWRVYLDAKHRGGEKERSGRAELSLKDLKKKSRQIALPGRRRWPFLQRRFPHRGRGAGEPRALLRAWMR
jgi:hypothetical protein